MSFFEQYRSGNLVLPNALFFHFKDIFPSADDFLVWQFLYLQTTTQIGEVASSQIAQANTQLIKQLTDELEQALGILNPMVIEDLNKEIQEEHTDPELIREALKEAVFNRKTNWNYIKGVLRNWKLSGITTKIQVEERRLEHQGKKHHHQVSDDFKTGMDAARQLWGGQ